MNTYTFVDMTPDYLDQVHMESLNAIQAAKEAAVYYKDRGCQPKPEYLEILAWTA